MILPQEERIRLSFVISSVQPKALHFPWSPLAFIEFPGELKSTAILIRLPWEFQRSRYNLFLQPLHSLPPPSLRQAVPISTPLPPLSRGPSCALRGDTDAACPERRGGEGRGGDPAGEGKGGGGGATQGGDRAPPRSQRGAAEGCVCGKEAFGCLVTGCQNGERG